MKNQKRTPLPLNLQLFSANLQQLLQTRNEKIQRQSTILAKARAEGERDLTQDEASEFDSLETEIQALDAQVEAKNKQTSREATVAARMRDLGQPAEQPFRPAALSGSPTQAPVKDTAGFESLGEFMNAVRFGDSTGRLESFRNDFSMGSNPDGGFMVPEQFREELLRLAYEAAVVRPRANVIPAGSPPDAKITMPTFVQGAAGAYGGATVTWIGEGEAKPKTEAKLDEITLEPHEVAAHVVVTDKLLRNWTAANGFLRSLLSQAMAAAEDTAFLKGDGVGKPFGVIPAEGRLLVNRQLANVITYNDLVTMLSKMLPSSLDKAVWVVAQSAMPELMLLEDPAGNYIFNGGDATRGIGATLLGRPIRFTGKTGPKGTVGDVALVDFDYYLIKDGSGPYIAASEHVHFVNNKTVIKCFWNVDGKPWVKTPLTLEDGVTKASPYVVLGNPSA
ncbi:phage major capsid protein [Paenibacillus caseinilyticus]|uniref:phage major capsid protein n=1 Tax=Paenibacillus caseinilyticus TaxID=3098138 RepID=UPI0022B8C49B|nr:phage major capsid protein [Paenibacillus caseinilyticus]MCZ8518878.1 phage major capsid protein [Paenibacillus caseinilyticus]